MYVVCSADEGQQARYSCPELLHLFSLGITFMYIRSWMIVSYSQSHATTNREGLVLKMSDEHLVASPHPSPLTDSSSHRPHPHKSHSLGNHPVAASVFPLATDPLPLSSSSAMSSRHVVRPLTLSAVSLPPPVTSATPAKTPPSVIGPTAHLASGDVVMSRDNHVISHGVSHDRGKERLFSPHSVEDDQMRRIEKVWILSYSQSESVCLF